MDKKYKLLLGFLAGTILIFFIPLFPISIPNMEGTLTSIAWFNGLYFLQHNAIKSFTLLQSIGGLTGFLMAFIFIGGFD